MSPSLFTRGDLEVDASFLDVDGGAAVVIQTLPFSSTFALRCSLASLPSLPPCLRGCNSRRNENSDPNQTARKTASPYYSPCLRPAAALFWRACGRRFSPSPIAAEVRKIMNAITARLRIPFQQLKMRLRRAESSSRAAPVKAEKGGQGRQRLWKLL